MRSDALDFARHGLEQLRIGGLARFEQLRDGLQRRHAIRQLVIEPLHHLFVHP